MANESFANTPLVEVDGHRLPTDVAALLTYVLVEDSRNLPAMFVLRFRDPQRVALTKGHFTVGAKVTVTVKTAEPGAPHPLVCGEVTALEVDLDAAGSFTQVRGFDQAHRLMRGSRVAAYPNMSLGEVVRKVAQRAGLTPGTIDAVPGVGGQQHTQLSQDNVSDWDFLARLADLVGAQVVVTDGKLDFRLPTPPSAAPSTNAAATTNPLVLEADRNLLALRASISATQQVPEVRVGGWDSEHKQELAATATPGVAGSDVDGLDPATLARTFHAPPLLLASAAYHSQGEVKAAARAVADQVGGASAELEGVAKGNPRLRAGVAVALAGVGEPFAGRYTLTSTRHVFSEQAGYTTSFTVSGRQERSLYGLVQGGNGVGGHAGRGLVPAVVCNVRDPLHLGRVKLTFPWLAKDYTSGWARTVQAGGGGGRGGLVLPEVGDEVLVGFAGGDLDTPYVLGGLHNGRDRPPQLSLAPIDEASGQVAVRAFVSRAGHRLEFVDAERGAAIVLRTGDGRLELKLDSPASTVELRSSGQVKVTGRGVTVDAGDGVLELKGKQVRVAGQTSAELTATSPTNDSSVIIRADAVRIN